MRQLDQQPIDPSIAFVSTSRTPNSMINPGLSSASKSENAKKRSTREPVIFPLKVTSGFFESEGTRDFVAGFLMKYVLLSLPLIKLLFTDATFNSFPQ